MFGAAASVTMAAMTELLLLVAVLAAATAFGAYRVATEGRLRRAADAVPPSGEVSPGPDLPVPAEQLGERATLLQFSSAFCTPCRATRQVLATVAEVVPGVRHVELDVAEHVALTERLNIRRTPTTLVLDAQGLERTRAVGVPRNDQVLGTLEQLA